MLETYKVSGCSSKYNFIELMYDYIKDLVVNFLLYTFCSSQ